MFKSIVALSALVSAQALAAQAPNSFNCKGDGIEIRFFESMTRSVKVKFTTPAPMGRNTLQAINQQIRISNTPIGRLVTITDNRIMMFDGPSHSLTLVVPDVNMQQAPVVQFDSLLIETTHGNSIGGPGFVFGALQQSNVKELNCEASFMAVAR